MMAIIDTKDMVPRTNLRNTLNNTVYLSFYWARCYGKRMSFPTKNSLAMFWLTQTPPFINIRGPFG